MERMNMFAVYAVSEWKKKLINTTFHIADMIHKDTTSIKPAFINLKHR